MYRAHCFLCFLLETDLECHGNTKVYKGILRIWGFKDGNALAQKGYSSVSEWCDFFVYVAPQSD